MSKPRPAQRLSDYTSIPLEIFIVSLSVLPVLLLIYFYPALPERVPVFLNLRGEIEVWATKSVASVFRLPVMALDLQAICLLMKYGTVQPKSGVPGRNVEEYLQYQRRVSALSAGLWDWLRSFNAIKMCAESLDILFMSDGRLYFFRTAGRVVTWVAVILAIAGVLFYVYRLVVVKREMREAFGKVDVERQADKHSFNFTNKWLYAVIACIALYPVLVFWPL
jgi:hypothetical protein